MKREGISYTIDTLNYLINKYRYISPKFYFFIGMDNVNDLYRWKEPIQILQKCQVVAFGRPGFKPNEKTKEFLPLIKFVHTPLLEISSTFIRQRILGGHSIRYLIPEPVGEYIREKSLYK